MRAIILALLLLNVKVALSQTNVNFTFDSINSDSTPLGWHWSGDGISTLTSIYTNGMDTLMPQQGSKFLMLKKDGTTGYFKKMWTCIKVPNMNSLHLINYRVYSKIHNGWQWGNQEMTMTLTLFDTDSGNRKVVFTNKYDFPIMDSFPLKWHGILFSKNNLQFVHADSLEILLKFSYPNNQSEGDIVLLDNFNVIFDSLKYNSIVTHHFLNDYRIYPNPGNNQFSIENNGSYPKKFLLFDMLGRQIEAGVLGANSVSQINTNSLTKGIYMFVTTDSKGNTQTAKWVKE